MELTQIDANSPLPFAVPDSGDQEHYEESLRTEEDTLQDYYQQAILSDGLQRIDEYTYIVQDWNEHLGILEVSLAVSPL